MSGLAFILTLLNLGLSVHVHETSLHMPSPATTRSQLLTCTRSCLRRRLALLQQRGFSLPANRFGVVSGCYGCGCSWVGGNTSSHSHSHTRTHTVSHTHSPSLLIQGWSACTHKPPGRRFLASRSHPTGWYAFLNPTRPRPRTHIQTNKHQKQVKMYKRGIMKSSLVSVVLPIHAGGRGWW